MSSNKRYGRHSITATILSSLILCSSILFCPMSCFAESDHMTIDNVTYESDGTFYKVVSVDPDAVTITIPDEINGIPVRWGADTQTAPLALCTKLKAILTENDSELFRSIDGVLFSAEDDMLLAYPPAKSAISYQIPDGTRSIGNYAFQHCSFLQSVTIPETVDSVYMDGFNECNSLLELTGAIPMEHAYSIRNCINLEHLLVSGSPYSVVFADYPNLKSLEFTDDAVIEESITISGCPSLEKLDLPRSVKRNDNRAKIVVSDCAALRTLSFWNDYLYLATEPSEQIQGVQIENCEMLSKITIHASDNTSTQKTILLSDLPRLEKIIFEELETDKSVEEMISGTHDIIRWSSSAEFTVCGHSTNTSLIDYCEMKHLPFETIDIAGDVNVDGIIDIMDVILLNKYILGGTGLSVTESMNADVDHNDMIDATDSLNILKYVVKVIDTFGYVEPDTDPVG